MSRRALGPDGEPLPPSADPGAAFSEMMLYVLVRRDGEWWLAAGQNTPIRPRRRRLTRVVAPLADCGATPWRQREGWR